MACIVGVGVLEIPNDDLFEGFGLFVEAIFSEDSALRSLPPVEMGFPTLSLHHVHAMLP